MRMSRLLVGAAAAVLLVAYAATPAGAVWDPGLGVPRRRPVPTPIWC